MRKLFASLIALAALGWAQANAAVANQSCTPAVGSTTGQHFAANTTFSFTNVTVSSGGNLALTVQVFMDTNSTPTVSTVVWDQVGANQSLSQINAGTPAQPKNVETWALINPTVGTNKTVSITISASNAIFAQACVWTGVDQTGGATSFPHTASATGASTVTVTSSTGNIVLNGASSGTALSGITNTTIFSDSANGSVINAFANFANGAASVTIGQANTSASISAIDIQAAGGGGSSCAAGSLALMGVGC